MSNTFLKSKKIYASFQDTIKRDSNFKRLIVLSIIVFLLMGLLNPSKYFTAANFESMLFQIPEFGLFVLAIMLAFISGGIDLSVVGIANLSGIIAAYILTCMSPEGLPGGDFTITILAILVALAIGQVAGLLNGLLIGVAGITPMLATLGTMQLFLGICVGITNGETIHSFPEVFLTIGKNSFLSVPIIAYIFIIIAIGVAILLNKTTFGFKLKMMGSNSAVTRFSGVNNAIMTIKTYLLTGFLASVSGLIIISRSNSAKADYGTAYILQAILVCVLGGVKPEGGFGKVMGVVLGIITLQFLSSGFSMLRFPPYISEICYGGVLILVMIYNYYRNMAEARTMKGG
jgi:simple sugar transport system permease protein